METHINELLYSHAGSQKAWEKALPPSAIHPHNETLQPCPSSGGGGGSLWNGIVLLTGFVAFLALETYLHQQALFLCAPFLPKKGNVHLFSSSLPRFDKCHETSRIFPRTEQTFASARSFGVIS